MCRLNTVIFALTEWVFGYEDKEVEMETGEPNDCNNESDMAAQPQIFLMQSQNTFQTMRLRMEFMYQGKKVAIRGAPQPAVRWTEGKPLANTLARQNFTYNSINIRPYRHPPTQKDAIEAMVKELLVSGVIRSSHSPFSSPIMMVTKKDGSWRMFVDYRALNKQTIKDKFSIPIIEELIDELFGAQALMSEVFAPFLRKFVLVFFDDILVYSRDMVEHAKHMDLVLSTMQFHQLFAKMSKCVFRTTQVEYFGHVITGARESADPSKIKEMQEWHVPMNIKKLKGFLGLTDYYRRFVKDYATISWPTALLKKNSIEWSNSAQMAFDDLKTTMVNASVLALPNFQEEFIVETDASNEVLSTYVLKWLPKLLGYDYEIIYKKGSENLVVDALSMSPLPSLQAMVITDISNDLLQRIKASWELDPSIQQIINKVKNRPVAGSKFKWQDELRRNDKLLIGADVNLRKELLKLYHDEPFGGHYGVEATYKRKIAKVKNAVVYWLVQWSNGDANDTTWEVSTGDSKQIMNTQRRDVHASQSVFHKEDMKVTFVNTEAVHKLIMSTWSEKDDPNNLMQMVSIPDEMGPLDDRNDIGKLNETITRFEELALGLELTNRSFLWVTRPGGSDSKDHVYPSGYMERVGTRGKIVSWAPQQEVLNHPSVACFMSHCGWNSTMEGVSNGVPFLCWPYFADQFLNTTYVCDIWKTGMALNKDETSIVTRGEIKSKVEQLLNNNIVKQSALQLQEKVVNSVREGNSSNENLLNFIDWIKEGNNNAPENEDRNDMGKLSDAIFEVMSAKLEELIKNLMEMVVIKLHALFLTTSTNQC
ncbi:retrotransposon-related protein [Tanacetum coccineum]